MSQIFLIFDDNFTYIDTRYVGELLDTIDVGGPYIIIQLK
jgi:hypothetical protein